ncbi:MAG: hypothetical protein AAB367_02990 [Patescibacteria group bacterium]
MGRCGNLMPCREHEMSAEKAPPADGVWLNLPLTPELDCKFAGEGIPLHVLTAASQRAIQAARREYGGRIGAKTEQRGSEQDQGCKVFGVGGLAQASIKGLAAELRRAGFDLLTCYRQEKETDPKRRRHLRVLFVDSPDDEAWSTYVAEALYNQRYRRLPWQIYQEEIESNGFTHTHVYANPRDEFGNVVHTVNPVAFLPGDYRARHQIRYNEGMWGAATK